MEMKLTENMESIVQKIVGITPKEIQNMSVDEIEKHTQVVRKQNRLFYKIQEVPFIVCKQRKRVFSSVMPRGSMIAAHYRFTYREDTNRKIMKIR